jgi:hypothetical protein
MQVESAVKVPRPKFSQQMRAVLAILASDQGLFDATSPFIDFSDESIDWAKVLGLQLCPSHMAVCHFAYACSRDEFPSGIGTNSFNAILDAEPHFLRAIVKGLATRWGVSR